MDIVELLVGLVESEYLEILDANDYTALEVMAFCTGDTKVAQYMVNKNRKILGFSTAARKFPFSLAISHSHNEMGRYLYSVTPLDVLKREGSSEGLFALYSCLNGGEVGTALDLLQRCPDLLSADFHSCGWSAVLGKIAAMPSAFSRGSQLVFWKRWIYNYINIQSTTGTNSVRLNIHWQGERERAKGVGLLSKFISYAHNMSGLKGIYELKLVNAYAAEILKLICRKVSSLDSSKMDETRKVFDAICRAAREGNVEFVKKVSKANPQLIMWSAGSEKKVSKANPQLIMRSPGSESSKKSSKNWDTFFYAVEYRQADVFNLIHGLPFKHMLASAQDSSANSMLHVAAKLAPSSQLNRISGPAFQMQSELRWFKEVESIVPPECRVRQNKGHKKPEDIFKESHKELRKEGEKWMKETASSCSVVGALVVTIMFAAAFTVPGGNNQEFGYPILLEEKLFILFVISDAFSLFSSTTSVLIFLGIFTSRYAEEDFLKSLPTKLIIGLSTLFLSIATMMIAFSATILIMLQNRPHSWVYLPIVMLASIPVTLFVLLQFPLLVRMVSSTYCPGIFNRNVKPWL